MAFEMIAQPVEWIDTAPVQVHVDGIITAAPAAVFATLADHERWPTWFPGMRRARVDGPSTGVGALRTVWVGPAWFTERFVSWEPGSRFSFTLTGSTAPGLRSMVEDFTLEPVGDDRTRVHYAVGLAGAGPGRVVDPLLRLGARLIVRNGLKGLTAQHSRSAEQA